MFTTKKADNSFTNYSLASTVTKKPIVGGQTGDRVTLSGAVEQAYTPSGKTDGAATKQAVVVDASCRVVEPEQPAPSFAPPKKKSTPTTKPNAAKTN